MVTMLNTNSIVNNANNPRKDLGDLIELRDSIKRNGVLQPLTVVPYMDGYKVVIGHRRLEAARQAECEEVPCIIEDWSEEEQLNVMMMENMLREQLSTYEEAKGFQMMLDLGKSVEQIAEETGFSQSTVRNRTRLLKLNEDGFKQSVERGATLSDLSKLYEIDDEHTRNAVLKFAGTPDFNSKVNKAISDQETQKKLTAAIEEVRKWATEIQSKDEPGKPIRYLCGISSWSPKIPAHEDDKVYYMLKCSYGYDIYVEGDDTEQAEREARRARDEMIGGYLCKEAAECYKLRADFIRNFGNFKKYGKRIMSEFMKQCVANLSVSGWRGYNLETLGEVMGIDDLKNNLDKLNEYTVEKMALFMLSVYNDSDDKKTWESKWTKEGWEYVYTGNDALMNWYAFLISIGYQASTQEQDMLNGNVQYVEKEEEVA